MKKVKIKSLGGLFLEGTMKDFIVETGKYFMPHVEPSMLSLFHTKGTGIILGFSNNTLNEAISLRNSYLMDAPFPKCIGSVEIIHED